jgi:hypothetical protein
MRVIIGRTMVITDRIHLVLDVLDPTFVYTFICVEIKTNTETVASRVFQKVQTTLVREAQFYFYRVFEGRRRPDFF